MKFSWFLLLLLFLPCGFAFNASVTEVSLNSIELVVHHAYSVFVVIHNDSNSPIDTNLTMCDGNSIFFNFRYNINTGADLNIAIPYTPAFFGDRNIMATIDLNDDNPSDNNRSKEISVFKGQDPMIANVFLAGYQLPNIVAHPQIFIINSGDRYSGFFDITYLLDDVIVFSGVQNPMFPNESKQLDFNFTTPASGAHVFKVVIDRNNSLDEYDKTNNSGQTSFIISASTDGNLSRDDIYNIIDQYFKERVDETKAALTVCLNANAAQSDALNLCNLAKGNAITLGQGTQNELNTCTTAKQTCETNLANTNTTQKSTYDSQLATFKVDYEKRTEDQKTYYESLLKNADQNLSALQESLKSSENTKLVISILFLVVMIFVASWIVTKGRLPLK